MNLVLSKPQQLQQNGNSQFVSVIIDTFDNYYNRKATNFENSVNRRFLNFIANNDLYLTYYTKKTATRQNLSLRQIEPFLQSLGVKSKKQYISSLNKLTKVLHSENIVKVVNDPHEKHKRDIDLILSEWLDTIDFNKTKQTYKNAFVSFDKYVSKHLEGSQLLETEAGAMVNVFTSKNAEGWKAQLLDDGKSIYTVNCWLSALKSFCRFTSTRDEVFNLPSEQREQVIRELNRIRDIKNIKLDTNPEHEKGAFTREELEQLINKPTDTREKLLFAVCGYLGLRIKEALGMQFKDIKEGSYKVIGKGYKKKSQVPFMPSKVWELFQELESDSMNDYIFEGWNYQRARKIFNETLASANLSNEDQDGKPRTLHSLRHSFCQIITDKTSLEFASRLCRHKSLEVTKRYYQAKINRHDFSQYSEIF